MNGTKSRPSGKKQESEQRDSWEATVEEIWYKQEAGRVFMENDKE